MVVKSSSGVWMEGKGGGRSVARAIAVDVMLALKMDASNDFRTRDKIISAVSDRIDRSLDEAAQAAAPAEQVVLKPCPFCGGKAFVWGADVQCQTDGCIACAGSSYDFDSQQAAINAWNRRSDSPQPAGRG